MMTSLFLDKEKLMNDLGDSEEKIVELSQEKEATKESYERNIRLSASKRRGS